MSFINKIPVFNVPFVNTSSHPFSLLLLGIGLRMQQLSKTSTTFKALLKDQNFVLQMESDEGIARHYIVANNTVSSVAGKHPNPTFTIAFRDGYVGYNILIRSDAQLLISSNQIGLVRLTGDSAVLIWLGNAIKLIKPADLRNTALKYIQKIQQTLGQ